MKSLLAEFKEFINRGNVIDMAVGIIIGAAFTAIVTSLTDDIINPLIKLITGGNGTDVAGLTIPVAGTENGIDFGAFISAIINFLIVAWVVFMIVKAFNKMKDGTAKLPFMKNAKGCTRNRLHLQSRPKKNVRTAKQRLPSQQPAARTAPPSCPPRPRWPSKS